jgi:hypothetical protein
LINSAADIANDLKDIIWFNGWNLGLSWELHSEPDKDVHPW